MQKTITSIFMVPTLKLDKDKLKINNFINAYVKDVNKEIQYKNCIYLLFTPENIDNFRDFVLNEYDTSDFIVDDYILDEKSFVIVYRLDEKYNKDYELIKQGKYSKTSKEFQSLFPKFIKILRNGLYKEEVSLQYRIFNKTEDMVKYWEDKLAVDFSEEYEVWEGWNEEKEILNFKN